MTTEKTTSDGFVYKLDESALQDWETLELLDEMQDEPQKIVRFVKRVLGVEQYNRLKEHCRKENGVVDVVQMQREIADIMKQKEVKNL